MSNRKGGYFRIVSIAATSVAIGITIISIVIGSAILFGAGIAVLAAGNGAIVCVKRVQVSRSRQRAMLFASNMSWKSSELLARRKTLDDASTRDAFKNLSVQSPDLIEDYFAFQEGIQAIFLIDDYTSEVPISLYPNNSNLENDEYMLVELITCFIEEGSAIDAKNDDSSPRIGNFSDIGKKFYLFSIGTGITLVFVTESSVRMPEIVPVRVIDILRHLDEIGNPWDENGPAIFAALIENHLPWSSLSEYYAPAVDIELLTASSQAIGNDEILDDLYSLKQALTEQQE
ncbi:MAG TPA: hypothetical protein VKM55_29295 [Candidatus Lokiarchaeia archaeon]|nr:hypothetical protein [Candidatus Lokiarchaeia archaeon]